jgi:superfamily II DNA or RNA helicase
MISDYQKLAFKKLRDQDGVLVMDDVGMGKTRSAAYTAYCLIKIKKVEKVIFLVPANLINNNQFESEFETYLRSQNESLDYSIYEFFSFNKFVNFSFKKRYFKKCLLVVDEADIMANAFNEINKKKGKTDLFAWKITWAAYHSCKTLLLTATPFRNRLSDFLSYYITLSKPKNLSFRKPFYTSNEMKKITRYHSEFMKKNVVQEDIKIILQKLKPFIIYNRHIENEFPIVKYIRRRHEDSFEECNYFLDQEDNLVTIDVDFKEEAFIYELEEQQKDHVYISNKTLYVLLKNYPRYANFLGISDASIYEKKLETNEFNFIHEVNILRAQAISSHLLNTCRDIIISNKSYPVLIYTFFLSQGVDEIISTLEFKNNFIKSYITEDSGARLYAVITGRTKEKERKEIMRLYNTGKIDILMISGAANVGVNLTSKTRQVHILSLDWNAKSIIQTVGRALRRNNHKVHVFIYKSVSTVSREKRLLFRRFKHISELPNITLTKKKSLIHTSFMEKIINKKIDRTCTETNEIQSGNNNITEYIDKEYSV